MVLVGASLVGASLLGGTPPSAVTAPYVPPILDRQLTFGGVTLGTGRDYRIRSIDGLSAPPVRSSDSARAGRHGISPGADFYEHRTITLEVGVTELDDAVMSTKLAALRTAFAGTGVERPMTLQLPGVAEGGVRRINCRQKRTQFLVDRTLTAGYAVEVVQLVASDPRIYDDLQQQAQTTLPEGAVGLTFPLTFPLVFGATTSGVVNVTNDGNFETGPVLRIDGPVTDPRCENVTAGRTIELDIDIAAGDFVEIDTEAHSILLNGTASRYSALTPDSQWWNLAPGENEIRFRAGSTGSARMTVTWRSAWIA